MNNLENLLDVSQLEGLNLDIMFGAVPKMLISDTSKKYSKAKTKNLFYVIFGVHIPEADKYLVFSSIFRSEKKKVDKFNWFKDIKVDSAVFDDKQKVLSYLYSFIGDFSAHERIINEEVIQMGPMPAEAAFEYLLVWNKGIFEYFNEHIKQGLPRKTRKKQLTSAK